MLCPYLLGFYGGGVIIFGEVGFFSMVLVFGLGKLLFLQLYNNKDMIV